MGRDNGYYLVWLVVVWAGVAVKKRRVVVGAVEEDDMLTSGPSALPTPSPTGLTEASYEALELIEEFESQVDAMWLLITAMLVLLMQAGFALVEVGSVQKGAAAGILLKNVLDAGLGGLMWWATGFGFAYGADRSGVLGASGFFYQGDGNLVGGEDGNFRNKADWFFQYAFASVCTTIVSGAVAERANLTCYAFYSCLMTGFMYPVVAHLAWSDNGRFSAFKDDDRLFQCGLIDFAGSGVVHLTGGVAALAACWNFRPRPGAFDGRLRTSEFNVVFHTLGTLLLWVGWYGFNCGSTLGISNQGGSLAAHVAMNTTLAAGAAAATASVLAFFTGDPTDGITSYTNNGILAGLVSITAGCAVVSPVGAFLTGAIGGCVYYATSRLIFYRQIDDAVDAFAVHGACGVWGLIAASLFATEYYYQRAYDAPASKCAGAFYANSARALGVAVFFSALVFVVVGLLVGLLFFTLDVLLKRWSDAYPMGIALVVETIDDDELSSVLSVDSGGPSDNGVIQVDDGTNKTVVELDVPSIVGGSTPSPRPLHAQYFPPNGEINHHQQQPNTSAKQRPPLRQFSSETNITSKVRHL